MLGEQKTKKNVILDLGWGRLIFSNTFKKSKNIVDELCKEKKGQKDLVVYNNNPQIILSKVPQEIFLDPSYFYRLNLEENDFYEPKANGFTVRRLKSSEAGQFKHVLEFRQMVAPSINFIKKNVNSRTVLYFVAVDDVSGKILGVVTAIDHKLVFNDSKNGASFWELAVDPQATLPGVGFSIVAHVINHFKEKGGNYLDLSVMHDNSEAIALYEKMGFKKLRGFCLKHKNIYNESLFVAPHNNETINAYSEVIITEAKKRGIKVDIIDKEEAYFNLEFGGKIVACWESLPDLTNAIAMSRCQDKRVTQRFLGKRGFKVPKQELVSHMKKNEEFLKKHKQIVVKAAALEKGEGVFVNLKTMGDVQKAIKEAKKLSSRVLLEEFVKGKDMRILVIGFEVIACASRTPATIVGTGKHKISDLIKKFARRRHAATMGSVKVVIDGETKRCVKEGGYTMESVLPLSKKLRIRGTANVASGGSVKDVSVIVSPKIKQEAVRITKALNIPVAGLDFIVPKITGDKYTLIEVNERPDFTLHSNPYVAEKYVDFLFPQTRIIKN